MDGDRQNLCRLFAAIAIAADTEAQRRLWLNARSSGYNDWFIAIVDERFLDVYAKMERGYLGLSLRVPAALRAFVAALQFADGSMNAHDDTDVDALLAGDQWRAVVLAARVVVGLTKDWRDANCPP